MTTRVAVRLVITVLAAGLILPAAAEAAQSRTTRLAAAPLAKGAGYGLRGGSPLVRTVQRRLDRTGDRPGPVDGLFGPLTEAAVIHFQRRHGLVVDGLVGPRTYTALKRAAQVLVPGAGYGTRHGAVRVRRVQRRLGTVGFHPGPVDGRFGPQTEQAVIRFQRHHGLVVDGRIGPATLKALRHETAAAKRHVRDTRETDEAQRATAPSTASPPRVHGIPTAASPRSAPPIWAFALALLLLLPLAVRAAAARGGRIWPVPAAAGADEADPGVLGYVSVRATDPDRRSDAQIEAIRAECRRRGLELVGIVRTVEPADPDEEEADRDGLGVALELIEEGLASGLVVADLYSVSRSRNALRGLFQRCERTNARLISVKPPLDTADRSQRLRFTRLASTDGGGVPG